MSEKDKEDKKDRIEEKTIIEKTEIISNTNFQANQIDTLGLFNITKFKEYKILKQLEILSKLFNKMELKKILYKSIDNNNENIAKFLVLEVFNKSELKEMLYETMGTKKENIIDFLVFKVFNKKELKEILYELVEAKKENITDFLISKVFNKKELKEMLYESIETKKENITDFLVSKVFSKEELKSILYESIRQRKKDIVGFLFSKVFDKMELKEMLYQAIEEEQKDIVDFLVFQVFNKQEIQEIFNESINKCKLKVVVFLIFNVFNNNKIEELFNKDILDKLVKVKDEHNRTILHYAVLQNKLDLVKFLLSNYWHQIDVNLIELIIERNPDIFKYWTKILGREKLKNILYSFYINTEVREILYEMKRIKKEKIAEYIISEFFSKEEIKNILYEAIEDEKKDMAIFLISKFFNKQQLIEMLNETVQKNNMKISVFLIKNTFGKEEIKNAFFEYFEKGNFKVSNFLIFILNKGYLTDILFDSLSRNDVLKIVEFMLSRDKQLAFIKDKNGRTLLHHAVINNLPHLVKFLINYYRTYKEELYINLQDNLGYTPLDYAKKKNYDQIVKILTNKVIIYNDKQYENIEELLNEIYKDENIFYFIVKIVEDESYKDLLRKEDIEIIDYYKNKVNEIKKVNDIKLVASLFISKKNREFNLFGISLNPDKLVEICKKYLDSTDLKELTAQELNIIKLIKNYYLKKVDEYNIFEVYEISKIKNKVKNIALDRIFRQIKKIKINNSNINLLFSFIISLVQVKGFYELVFSKKNICLNNLNNKLDIVDFIVENGNDIFRYWDKALGKEKLKNILYNKILNSIKKKNSNFPNYNEEMTKEIFFEAIQQGDKDSVEFLIFEVFNEEVLKNALYEAVEKIDEEKLKKILKEVLYKAIENNILKIINLISNFFTKKELEDILEYYDLEYDENDNIIEVREKKLLENDENDNIIQVLEKKLFEDDKKTEFMSPFNKGKCKFLFNITNIDYIRYFDFFYK
jgi:ankyrin repeat protein